MADQVLWYIFNTNERGEPCGSGQGPYLTDPRLSKFPPSEFAYVHSVTVAPTEAPLSWHLEVEREQACAYEEGVRAGMAQLADTIGQLVAGVLERPAGHGGTDLDIEARAKIHDLYVRYLGVGIKPDVPGRPEGLRGPWSWVKPEDLGNMGCDCPPHPLFPHVDVGIKPDVPGRPEGLRGPWSWVKPEDLGNMGCDCPPHPLFPHVDACPLSGVYRSCCLSGVNDWHTDDCPAHPGLGVTRRERSADFDEPDCHWCMSGRDDCPRHAGKPVDVAPGEWDPTGRLRATETP